LKTLKELRAERAETVSDLSALLDKVEAEKREMTDEEEKAWSGMEEREAELNEEIEKAEKREARRADLDKKIDELQKSAEPEARAFNPNVIQMEKRDIDTDKEFRGIGEMLHSIRFKPNDKRLGALYDSREQSMTDGVKGGFMVPQQFMNTLMSISPDAAILRSRSRVIPAGSPPDAAITIPVLDQTSSSNVYGGVVVDWIEEGATKPETDLDLQEIELKPKEVAGHIVTTDKLLRNWQAADSLLGAQLMAAKTGAEEYAIYTGSGVGQPLGVLNSPARINYTRAGANAIAYADVVGMLARLLRRGGTPVWVCNQTVIPQLANIVDANNNNIFVFDVAAGLPASLLGYPIVFNERVASLGSTGDLSLLDMSYYLIKDGSGPFIASSEHVHFTRNKTVIKMFWNVDGQPWLREPLQLEAGSSTLNNSASTDTVSPFIVLN